MRIDLNKITAQRDEHIRWTYPLKSNAVQIVDLLRITFQPPKPHYRNLYYTHVKINPIHSSWLKNHVYLIGIYSATGQNTGKHHYNLQLYKIVKQRNNMFEGSRYVQKRMGLRATADHAGRVRKIRWKRL